jgi:hypothetical protein
VFSSPIKLKLSTTDLVIKCACYLYNWLRTSSPTHYITRGCVDFEDSDTGKLHEGSWRSERHLGLSEVRNLSSNNCNKSAAEIRDQYADYFSGKVQYRGNLRPLEPTRCIVYTVNNFWFDCIINITLLLVL